MVLKINTAAKDAFEKFIRSKLLETWVAQGHNMTGKVVKEMDMVVEETSSLVSFLFYFLPYGVYQTPMASELYHYGVPGMKWGVRRQIAASARTGARQNRLARSSDKRVARLERRQQYQRRRS
jgi:hypothetical protein